MNMPRRAILFWYYCNPELCASRLRQLVRLNPGVPLFGLYGGTSADAPRFKEAESLLDDCWHFDETRDTEWKWRHGDQMLSRWFERRGAGLEWDSVVVVQWDVLALAPLARIFADLAPRDVYLPGLRPLAPLRDRWWWTRPGTPQGDDYLAFVQHMAEHHAYTGPFEACQFLAAVLPRGFMAAYAQVAAPEPGFLEYKLPTFARALGFNLPSLPTLRVAWPGEAQHQRIVLTAAKRDIPDLDIAAELLTPGGARLFHPVTRPMPVSARAWAGFVARRLPRLATNTVRSLHA
jgi:hypothetical protein